MIYPKNNNLKRKRNQIRKTRSNLVESVMLNNNFPLPKINIWDVNTLINFLSFLAVSAFLILVLQGFLTNSNNSKNINKPNIRPFVNLNQDANSIERGELKPFVATIPETPKQQVPETKELENSSAQTSNLDPNSDSIKTNRTRIYIVKSGDTLSLISSTQNVSIVEILKLNPNLIEPYNLAVGQQIILPAK
jgi:LysM repeat protein